MKHYCCYGMYADVGHDADCPSFRLSAAPSQPAAQPEPICRSDGRCQYAIDHAAEGLGHCPQGKCAMPEQPEPGGLTDAQLIELGRATTSKTAPWGIGSTRGDYLRACRAIEREVLSITRKPIHSTYIADMEGTLRELSTAVGLDPSKPDADALIAAVKSLRKRSDAEVARIMEAVDAFGNERVAAVMATAYADPERKRAEVERLLRGEA